MSIKDQYENLSPKQKKLVLWGGGGILLVTALYFLTSEPEYQTAASAVNNKPVTNLLTNADTQGVSQNQLPLIYVELMTELIVYYPYRNRIKRKLHNCMLNKKY